MIEVLLNDASPIEVLPVPGIPGPRGETGPAADPTALNAAVGQAQSARNDAVAAAAAAQATANSLMTAPTIVSVTTFAPVLADWGKTLRFTNTSGCAITLPSTLPAGFFIRINRAGNAGAVTVAMGSGSTNISPAPGTTLITNGKAVCEVDQADAGPTNAQWNIAGDLI